jgi:hypothetical protein
MGRACALISIYAYYCHIHQCAEVASFRVLANPSRVWSQSSLTHTSTHGEDNESDTIECRESITPKGTTLPLRIGSHRYRIMLPA